VSLSHSRIRRISHKVQKMQDHSTIAKPGFIRRPDHVLFFAAIPPPDINAQMAKAWQTFGTGEDFRHDKLHLSIHAVAEADNLDPILITRAQKAPISLRTAPFTLSFDRLAMLGGDNGKYALVVQTAKANRMLSELAAELHSSCRAMGITASRSKKPTPHVTLAYGPGFPEVRLLDKPIHWIIDEVALIDSHRGQGRHVLLGRWPLPEDRQQPGFDF
jgi:2'-5' RNA ligase